MTVFDLEDALQYGLLPIVWDSDDKSETLTAYTQMYLREEIQSEALVRNLPGFARFLPVAALFSRPGSERQQHSQGTPRCHGRR